MSEKQNESLSALMDGELDELALHRVLKDVENNPEMRDTWSRFHMGREALKGGGDSQFLNLDISAQVSAAIQDEPMDSHAQTGNRSLFKAIAGLGIAASVTFAVVLGARFNPLVETGTEQQLANKTEIQIVKPGDPIKGPSMIAQSAGSLENLDEEQLQQAQERLNSYLKQHAKDSALGHGRTAMPYARVVNFEESTKQRVINDTLVNFNSRCFFGQLTFANQSLSAQGWYERMLEMAPKALYQGIFTHQAGNKMQSVEIVHGENDGQIWERMLHLDGPSREIIRRGEDLFCIHPDASVEQLQKQDNSLFGSKSPGDIKQLSMGYDFKTIGKQRIAGRLVEGVQLSPKDGTRHFYQLWLDVETSVPLKTELIARTGQVLERYQFNYFKPHSSFNEALFAPRTSGAKLDLAEVSRVLKTRPQDVLEWRLNWVPRGFIDQVAKGHAPKMSARRIYSDGIVMFSVYVESVDEVQDEGIAQAGPTVLSVQHKQWQGKTHRITVVGEIPAEAAQRIAQSVELL